MTTAMLPAQFSELERFAAKWVLPDANIRNEVRLASTMEEMQDFYNALVSRAEEAIQYLDASFELWDLPEQENNLLWLLMSLQVVGFAVDVFKQGKVPDSGDSVLPFTTYPGP